MTTVPNLREPNSVLKIGINFYIIYSSAAASSE